MKIDLERLTADETKELAEEALTLLPLNMKVQAVIGAFSDDGDREELLAWLEMTDKAGA